MVLVVQYHINIMDTHNKPTNGDRVIIFRYHYKGETGKVIEIVDGRCLVEIEGNTQKVWLEINDCTVIN